MNSIIESSWYKFDDEREKLNRIVLEAIRAKRPLNSKEILEQNITVHKAYSEFASTACDNI